MSARVRDRPPRRRDGRLDLWQRLDVLKDAHDIHWRLVRGHDGHLKNEYANHLATRAAREQQDSGGLVGTGFEAWLAAERERGRYLDEDPDAI